MPARRRPVAGPRHRADGNPLAAWPSKSASRRKGDAPMPSRRTFLRAAAATVAVPFAGISHAAATPRTILNDASRLSPTPVTKHVRISRPAWRRGYIPATDTVLARLTAYRHRCAGTLAGARREKFRGYWIQVRACLRLLRQELEQEPALARSRSPACSWSPRSGSPAWELPR